MESELDSHVIDSLLNIYRETPVLIRIGNEEKFRKSLLTSNTILITLRTNDHMVKLLVMQRVAIRKLSGSTA